MSAWADNPQAAEIDAVVERAGELTHAEIKALHVAEARDAAWDAAFDAAFDAAWDAARAAAWAAAWDAAWAAARAADRAAAWDAARDAARDAAGREAARAARALVVRDLIDENTAWNQAAYDLLSGPWRRVVGSIHPDDEVLA